MAAVAIEFVATLRARVQKIGETGDAQLDEWPETINFLIRLFEHNITNEFPLPRKISPSSSSIHPSDFSGSPDTPSRAGGDRTPNSDDVHESTTPTETSPTSQSLADQLSTPTKAWRQILPAEALPQCEWIHSCLTTKFSRAPPCTVQRLAELLLTPRHHYRFLLPYLTALDRLVSVSAPHLIFSPSSGSRPQATSSHFAYIDNTHSGANLVPIPWLDSCRSNISDSSQASSFQADGGERTKMVDTDMEMTLEIGMSADDFTDPDAFAELDEGRIRRTKVASRPSAHADEDYDDDDDDDEDDSHSLASTDGGSTGSLSPSSLFSESRESASSEPSDVDHTLHSDGTDVRLDPDTPHASIEFPKTECPSESSPLKDKASPSDPSKSSPVVSSPHTSSADGSVSPPGTTSISPQSSAATGVRNNRKRPASSVLDHDSPVSPHSKVRLTSPTDEDRNQRAGAKMDEKETDPSRAGAKETSPVTEEGGSPGSNPPSSSTDIKAVPECSVDSSSDIVATDCGNASPAHSLPVIASPTDDVAPVKEAGKPSSADVSSPDSHTGEKSESTPSSRSETEVSSNAQVADEVDLKIDLTAKIS